MKYGCAIFIYGDRYTLFAHTVITCEFDKMQIPLCGDISMLHSFHVKLVWRLLEFAFLCAYFGGRTFIFILIFGGMSCTKIWVVSLRVWQLWK